MFGNVIVSNFDVVILDYVQEKLLIDVDIKGLGKEVGFYFNIMLLKELFGVVLDFLQLDGDVSVCLYLNIFFDGEMIIVKGDVCLQNNSLFIKLLDIMLQNLSGNFSFVNGDFNS